MSHSTAAVKFSDGLILFGEYNGTADVMLPKFYLTKKERNDNWRTNNWPIHDKNCDKAEDVIVATSYGRGFSWSARGCKVCQLLINKYMPYDDESQESIIINGLPDWYPDRELYKL